MPIKINGSTSGSVTLAAPATGSDVTLTLPGTAGTLATTTQVTAQSGLVPVTPTSVANGTTSGGTVSFSAASSVSLNGVFSTYDNYLIRISLTASTAATVQLRMRVSGSDNSSTNYYYHSHTSDTSSQSAYSYTRSNGLASFIHLGNINGVYDASVEVNSPALTRATTFLYRTVGANATDMQEQAGGGLMSVTTSYDGFSIVPSAGTITGSIRVFGFAQ